METSCTFGFEDLFWAAHARAWTPLERRALEDAAQPQRNGIVRGWAEAAGGVELEDRRGTDGAIYTAFRFRRPPWWDRLRWLDAMPGPAALATIASPAADPAGDGPVVLVVARAGGPLVPGKAAAVTHDRDLPSAVRRVRPAVQGLASATVHAAVADAAAGDLAGWLADYLRCPVL